jgi:hypothetical protein
MKSQKGGFVYMKSFTKFGAAALLFAVLVVSFGCDKMKKQEEQPVAEATAAPAEATANAAPAAEAPAAAH